MSEFLINPYRFAVAVGGSSNPVTSITWAASYWASDPNWTPPADGATLASGWADGSVGARTLTNADNALRPVYRASNSNLNSKPAVEFAVDDWLGTSSTVAASQPFSIVGVLDSFNNNLERFVCNRGDQLVQTLVNGTVYSLYAGGGLGDAGTVTANGVFWVGVFNGASSKTVVAATSTNCSVSPGTEAFTGVNMGARAGGDLNLTGSVAFCGIYSGDITAAGTGWTDLKTWANSFYGVTT